MMIDLGTPRALTTIVANCLAVSKTLQSLAVCSALTRFKYSHSRVIVREFLSRLASMTTPFITAAATWGRMLFPRAMVVVEYIQVYYYSTFTIIAF